LLSFGTTVDRFILVDLDKDIKKWLELEVVVVEEVYCTLAMLFWVVEVHGVVSDWPDQWMVDEGKSTVFVMAEKEKKDV
jgi:hypothetical protein